MNIGRKRRHSGAQLSHRSVTPGIFSGLVYTSASSNMAGWRRILALASPGFIFVQKH